jgi:hypothetical protein
MVLDAGSTRGAQCRMGPGSRLLFLLLACALSVSPAYGAGPSADTAYEDALATHAREVATIERSLLALIAIAPDGDRFDLYRAYDEFLGAWVLVDGLHALLDRAITPVDPDDEEATRRTLRDQAEFTLGELDSALVALVDTARTLHRPDDYAVSVAASGALLRVRSTVAAMYDRECERLRCSRIR